MKKLIKKEVLESKIKETENKNILFYNNDGYKMTYNPSSKFLTINEDCDEVEEKYKINNLSELFDIQHMLFTNWISISYKIKLEDINFFNKIKKNYDRGIEHER